MTAAEGLRKLPGRVNSVASAAVGDGSSLGAEEFKGLFGIGHGFPRPEPGRGG